MLTPEERSAEPHRRLCAPRHPRLERDDGCGSCRVEAKFLDEVDPKRELDEDERLRRAGHAKSRYYTRLSYLAAKARAAAKRNGGDAA